MKIRILSLFIFIILRTSSTCAGQNRIDYLFCDEINQTLCIYGVFNSTPGSVFIEGLPLTVLHWSDSLVTCAIRDTGNATCGHVMILGQFGDSSNVRELSSYWFSIYDYLTVHTNYSEYYQYNWHLRLRVDMAPSSFKQYFSSAICRSSTFSFSYSYMPNTADPYSQSFGGSGALPWCSPDSTFTQGFSVSTSIDPNYNPQIQLGDGYATQTIYDSIVKPVGTEPLIISPGFQTVISFDKNYNFLPFSLFPSFEEQIRCGSDSEKYLPLPLGVTTANALQDALTISPNIVNGFVNISLLHTDGYLKIYNIIGNMLYNEEVTSNENEAIDTHSWPNGTYFVTYTSERVSTPAKFIVQH